MAAVSCGGVRSCLGCPLYPGFSWCLQLHMSCVSAFLLLWVTSFCILTLLSCFNLLTTCFHLPLILPRVLLLSCCVSTACELRYVIFNNPNLPV